MRYIDSMSSGDGTLLDDDRDRYGTRSWTSAREVLAARWPSNTDGSDCAAR